MTSLHLDRWESARAKMREEFGKELFERWIADVSLLSDREDEIELGVRNRFVLDWVRQRYLDRIERVCREAIGRPVSLKLSIDPRLFRQARIETERVFERDEAAGASRPSESDPGGPAPAGHRRGGAAWPGVSAGASGPPSTRELSLEPTLESFVVGPCNDLAASAVREILAAPRSLYNPLFLHGGSGVGKTHLLRGLEAAFRVARGTAASLRRRVRYVSAERFFSHFAASVQDGTIHRFRERYRSVDILIVEDLQQLFSKKKTQIELLHTVSALVDSGRQVIASADAPPRSMPDLDPSLVSRLVGGLVVRLGRPDYATRLEILRRRCEALGRRVDDAVLELVAERVRGGAHELLGILMRLDVQARFQREPLDVDATHRILSERLRQQESRISVGRIQEEVARHFSLTREDLLSSRRDRWISRARQVAMYLARRYTRESLPEIARRFGRRHHSVVSYAEKRIGERLEARDSRLLQDVETVVEALEAS